MQNRNNLAPRPRRDAQIKLNDKDLFGAAAGEDEDPKVLDSYYIDLPRFESFYALENHLSIVSARKGMGKSALLSRFEYVLKNRVRKKEIKAIVIKATGNSLLGLGNVQGKDHIYWENYWKQIICKRIIVEIGSKIKIAMSDEEMAMVEASEQEGFKNKNVVGSVISRVEAKVASSEFKIREAIPNNLEALLRNYQEAKDADIWLLIDDIDAKYIDSDEYKIIISSFFSAIRSLVIEVKRLNIRSTVRTDVWNNLKHFEDLDKCQDYLFTIEWSTEQLKKMLVKRVDSYIKREHPHSNQAKYDPEKDSTEILRRVFMDTMPWKGKNEEPHVPIVTLSNYRPRWMGELCKMAGNKAYAKEQPRIGIEAINKIMPEFGKNRVADLIKEHGYQFTDLEKLINSFRSGNRKYKYSELVKALEDNYILDIGISNIPSVDSRSYYSPAQLGEFLYKIEFISAVDKYEEGNFLRFQDDPYLFNALENRKDNIIWSIHPIYRKFLKIN